MKKARWLNLAVAGMLSAWLGWAGADPVTLQGEVLQKGSGDPILGASVYVVDNDSINATSDERGRFTLALPAPGDYILGVVAIGFESSKQIPITADAARGPHQNLSAPGLYITAGGGAGRAQPGARVENRDYRRRVEPGAGGGG